MKKIIFLLLVLSGVSPVFAQQPTKPAPITNKDVPMPKPYRPEPITEKDIPSPDDLTEKDVPMPRPKTPNPELERLTREITEEFYAEARKQGIIGPELNDPANQKKVDDIFNKRESLKKKKQKIFTHNYKPKPIPKQSGQSKKMSLLLNIPVPVEAEQASRIGNLIYTRYKEMVEEAWKEFQSQGEKLMQETKYRKGNEEAVKKEYKDKANKNEFVAGMGGVDKVQNMSEAERKKAADQQVMQMTGGVSREELQKMTPEQKKLLAQRMAGNKLQDRGADGAFTQELMVNEAYRKRYEAMSDADKQKEFAEFEKRYYGDGGKPATTQPTHTQSAEDQRQIRESRERIKWSAELDTYIKTAMKPINDQAMKYEMARAAMEKAIMDWGEAALKPLPVVRDSEYGPYKPGAKLVEVAMGYMELEMKKLYSKQRIEIWHRTMVVQMEVLKRVDDFVATYINRTDLSDEMKLALAGMIRAGKEGIEQMIMSASGINGDGKSAIDHFNCFIMYNCGDK